jgi:hypothetical protein
MQKINRLNFTRRLHVICLKIESILKSGVINIAVKQNVKEKEKLSL